MAKRASSSSSKPKRSRGRLTQAYRRAAKTGNVPTAPTPPPALSEPPEALPVAIEPEPTPPVAQPVTGMLATIAAANVVLHAQTATRTTEQAAALSVPTAEHTAPHDPASDFLWTRKDLLGLDELSAREIVHILDTAESFREVSTRSIKKLPTLRGKVVALLFFEDSTRTRMSFELAANRLGADTLLFTSRGSSVTKGETTLDTVRNIEAMGVDIFVLRHGQSGAPHLVARQAGASIVNAGDGQHEHPTQALLDMFTMRQRLGSVEGLKVAVVGDIAHSRVARSNILGLKKLGAEVVVVGPPTLVPAAVRSMGCDICDRLDDVLAEVDVINMLRIQFERFSSNLFPSVREYSRLYGLNSDRLKRCKPNVLIMHPGPINRGVELTSDVADGPNSCILQQVTNGLAIRMAVLYLVSEGMR